MLPGPMSARAAAVHPRTAGYSKPPLPLKKPLSTCMDEATIIVPATAALAPGVPSPTASRAPPPASPRPKRSKVAPVRSRPAPAEPAEQFLSAVGKQSPADGCPETEPAGVARLQNAMYTTNRWHYAIH